MDPEEAWALPRCLCDPHCPHHGDTRSPRGCCTGRAAASLSSPLLPFSPPPTAVDASPPDKAASRDADPGALKTHRGANRCINTA